MNWFVRDDPAKASQIAPAAPADFWEGAGAAWEAEMLQRDPWGAYAREEGAVLSAMAVRYLGENYRNHFRGGAPPKGEREDLDRMFALAAEDSERPADWPSSYQELEERFNRRRRTELQDAQAVARMGSAVAQFSGAGAASLATPFGVTSLVLPGVAATRAPNLLSAIGRAALTEGAIGATDAAIAVSDMNRVADQIGIERPDAMAQILVGGGAGAVLGGFMAAGARGVAAFRARNDVGPTPPGVTQRDHVAASDAVTRALETGDQLPPPPPARPTLTPELVEAVIWQESRGRARAVGPDLKNEDGTVENALGLMQVRPSTARRPGHGVAPLTGTDEEIRTQLLDPVVNRRIGEAYLGAMLRRYENLEDALVAYNWGPRKADTWIKNGRPSASLPQQTQDYVRSIRERMKAPSQAAPSAPMDWNRPVPATNAGGVYLPPRMTTPTGTKIGVRYEVVDLDRLSDNGASSRWSPRRRAR